MAHNSTAAAISAADEKNFDIARCRSSAASSFSVTIFNTVVILVTCKILHGFVRHLGQHRMVSDFIIGVLIGNVKALRMTVEQDVIVAITRMASFSFSLYNFVIGLEMDPQTILRWSGPTTKIAYAGILSTAVITVACYTAINQSSVHTSMHQPYPVICAIAVALSATSSPILTRLITELKISKSEIGRLAVRTGLANDMICSGLMCLGVLLYGRSYGDAVRPTPASRAGGVILNVLVIVFEVWFITWVIKPLFGKLNDRNPDGKPIRGVDMVIVCFLSAALCYCTVLFSFNPSFNAFIVGLCLPRDGRMSNFLIGRVNFLLTTFILPLFIVLVGVSTDYEKWIFNYQQAREARTAYKLMIMGSIGVVGKLTGTVGYCIRHGLQWQEAAALGLLLNVKGYFHVFCAYFAALAEIIDSNTMMVMLLVTVGTIVPTPLVVAFIVRRARAREKGSPMGLQWYNSGAELRVLVGLQGPQDVPMAVNVVEALRAQGDGQLSAFMVDMVELTDKAAASLVHGEGMEAVTVTDEVVVEMREQIGSALEAYREESGEGVRIRRLLAVSSFDDMHEDICSLALDCTAVLVVLPFHRRQRVDGAMDTGNPGYRVVNEKVLQFAPCSVGILVDRGLGRTGRSHMSLSVASQNICVVFIGGGDDREALAYSGRMANHPAVRLMVVRFLPDAAAMGKGTGPGRRVLAPVGRQEMEMRTDDEYLAGFYERFVAGGKGVGYMEKRVSSGAEMVTMLRVLEEQYHLFIVGRGKDRDSVLTAGMSEWAECPELGPIGDILSASDFSVTASVLVLQQHNRAQRYNVIDDDFLPL